MIGSRPGCPLHRRRRGPGAWRRALVVAGGGTVSRCSRIALRSSAEHAHSTSTTVRLRALTTGVGAASMPIADSIVSACSNGKKQSATTEISSWSKSSPGGGCARPGEHRAAPAGAGPAGGDRPRAARARRRPSGAARRAGGGRRAAPAQADQPDERPALGEEADVAVDQVRERVAQLAALLQHRDDLVGERLQALLALVEAALEDGAVEAVLVAEEVRRQGARDVRGAGDRAHAGGVVAVRAKSASAASRITRRLRCACGGEGQPVRAWLLGLRLGTARGRHLAYNLLIAQEVIIGAGVAFVDGEWFADAREARVPVLDHGLLYGDGIFEGIRFYSRAAVPARRAPAPAARLGARADARRCAGPTPSSRRCREAIERGEPGDGYIRLIVTRGAGALGCRRRRLPAARRWCWSPRRCSCYPAERDADGRDRRDRERAQRRRRRAAAAGQVAELPDVGARLARGPRARRRTRRCCSTRRGRIAECSADNVFSLRRRRPQAGRHGALRRISATTSSGSCAPTASRCARPSCVLADAWTADEAFLTGTGAAAVRSPAVEGGPGCCATAR